MVTNRRTDRLEVLCVVLLVGMLLAAVGTARGDDERARRAKVALALASAPASPGVVTTAPAPRAAGKLPYGDGYAKAAADQLPLVVFVSCDLPRPSGAISSKADGPFAGVQSGVVVGYPRGDRLWIDATITDPTPESVQKAVDAARRKIDAVPAPKAMPGAAPKPLDWQIRGPGVPQPPFATQATTARGAVVTSTSWPLSTPTAPTPTGARPAAPRGGTNCPT